MNKMRKKTKIFSSILFVSLIFISIIMSSQITHSKTSTIQINSNFNFLTPHVAIYIDNDGNFSDYGFPGTGASNDPYRIENYNITTVENIGIHISSASVYFKIQNCFVMSAVIGIDIYYCEEERATITNSISNGISVIYSDSIEISNNLVHEGGPALINVDHSDNAIIDNNTLVSENGYSSSTGIKIVDSDSSTISNNNITRIRNGIYVDHCPSSLITNNLLSDLSNYGYGNGINVYSSDGTVVDNNICTECDDFGIYVYSFGSVTVQKNTVTLSEYGIHIKTSTASLVKENTCTQNQIGIYIESSETTLIEKNSLSLNQEGISVWSSDYVSVSDNYCYQNEQNGLWAGNSKSIFVTRNNCSSNLNAGIILDTVTVSNITHNNISFNDYMGIILDTTSNCKFFNNLFNSNDDYAVFIGSGCSGNVLSLNSFIDNNLEGISQCFDSGNLNLWYNSKTKEGNYWNDLGENKTYAIDGLSNSIDKYPLNKNLERISLLFNVIIITLFVITLGSIQKRRKKK
jgi:parallel beta-helix repeat protein